MITPPNPTTLLTFVPPSENFKLQGGQSIFKSPKFGFKKPKKLLKSKKRSTTHRRVCSPLCKRV
jgi:hypothetical protein